MTTKDFKELWPKIEGRQVKIVYGKSTFHKIILTTCNFDIGVVNTSMKGQLNIRSIKSIDLIQVIEVKAEEVKVPQPETGLLKDGYFIIVGQLAGHWKKVELRDRLHLTKRVSQTYLDIDAILNWIAAVKKEDKTSPNLLIDDTFCIPEYYRLKPLIGGKVGKEKIIS